MESKQCANKTILLVKENKQRKPATDLNNYENQNQIFRIARQIVKERHDVTGLSCLKDATGKVVVDENGLGFV